MATGDNSLADVPLSVKQSNISLGATVDTLTRGGATTPPNINSEVFFLFIFFLNVYYSTYRDNMKRKDYLVIASNICNAMISIGSEVESSTGGVLWA